MWHETEQKIDSTVSTTPHEVLMDSPQALSFDLG